MDRDKQVSALFLGFCYAHLQRNEDVFIARHVHLHIALFLDQRAQTASYLQYHVFFACFVFPHRTGVFATVARVKHNDNRTIPPCFTRLWTTLCWRHLLFEVAFVVILQQRQQRVLHILCIGRIEVHHQTLFKPGDRRKGKQLRFYVLL
ncbi:hypothetical protein HmCmsJML188_02698 [Escherichia coli]|nr:hypothetical protein HmCmsJML188_02698 [Escherichia coli]